MTADAHMDRANLQSIMSLEMQSMGTVDMHVDKIVANAVSRILILMHCLPSSTCHDMDALKETNSAARQQCAGT